MSTAPVAPRRIAWLRLTSALLLTTLAAGLCLGLGAWQWSRAHARAEIVQGAPAVPLHQALLPASTIERGVLGSNVYADGEFRDGTLLVSGRTIDGEPATFLVKEFQVSEHGDAAGGTLAVIVGWTPTAQWEASDGSIAVPEGELRVEGYLRASEAVQSAPTQEDGESLGGALVKASISTAELAALWPAPMYSATLVSGEGFGEWEPLPPRDPVTKVNLTSLLYSLEWWLFGGFALFVSARWMRENRFHEIADTDEQESLDEHPST